MGKVKRIRSIVLFLAVLFVFTGCVSTDLKSEITPLNLYSQRRFASDDQVFFVGEGQADTLRQAELLSFMDLNNKVYRYLGIDVVPESYRELTTAGTIAAYNLRILERSSYGSDGKYTYAVIASANRNLLAKDRSSDMQKEEEIAGQAVDLVLQGDEYIKNNMDIDGLRCYLQSMSLSYGLQYIEDEFSFSAILEEVLRVLDVLEIRISNENPSDATCLLKVTRHDTIIPSKVKNGTLKATFTSEDSRGLLFTDSFAYTTNGKGVIDFVPRAYNMAKRGSVKFAFDFENEISQIESLSPSTADVLRTLIEERSVVFNYDRKTDNGLFAVCAYFTDEEESENSDFNVGKFFVEKYEESGISCFEFSRNDGETYEQLLQRFVTSYPKAEGLIVIRVGVTDVFETRMDICSVSVEGRVSVYNPMTGEIIYDSNESYAAGFGATVTEAYTEALKNYSLKMFTLLKAYYV